MTIESLTAQCYEQRAAFEAPAVGGYRGENRWGRNWWVKILGYAMRVAHHRGVQTAGGIHEAHHAPQASNA